MNEFRFEETPERIQEFEDLVRDLKAMDEEYTRQVYLRKIKELSTKKKKPTEVVNNERTD